MNIEAIIIANDLALHYLIGALAKTSPEVASDFSATLDALAIDATSELDGQLGIDVRDRLSALAAVAMQPNQRGGH